MVDCDVYSDLPHSTIYYNPAGPGGSLSVLLGFSDGVKRATKLMGNPQEHIILVNELVVSRLARLVCAPCPRGEKVCVNSGIAQAVRQALPNFTSAAPGVCFGSEWVEGQYSPGLPICVAATNRGALAGLITLYTWTRNTDLKESHLVWKTQPDGSVEVYGFDHGHCFDYRWDASIRERVADVSLRSLPQLTAAVTPDAVGGYIDRLRALTKQDFEGVVGDVPSEWGISNDALGALVDYLDMSRSTVERVLRQAFAR